MLKKYTKELLKPLPELLELAQKDFDEKAIHKIRVTIKKIRALASFLKFANPGLPLNQDLREVKSFFLVAGHLRDIQVQKQLQGKLNLTKRKELKTFFRKQEKQELKAKENLKNQLESFGKKEVYSLKEKLLRHIEELDPSALEELVRDYLHTLEYAIRADLARPSGKIPFHDIRKKVKKILYTLRMFKAIAPDTSLRGEKELAAFEKLQSALGNWQDRNVLIHQLSNFRKDAPDEVIEGLRKDIEKRESELLVMTKALLQDQ
jgi:CHAD domain-containing protein